MISPQSLQEIWFLLELGDAPQRQLHASEAETIETASGRPLFTVDANHQRHLLIPVGIATALQEDKRSGGVHIASITLEDKGIRRQFVDVICRKSHLHELFSIIASEMLNNLTEDPEHPDHVCIRVLGRWRELLEREPSSRPSPEKLIGLYGELWHLREIIRRNPTAIGCWVGPTGARHDLAAGNIALEIKTTTVRHGRFCDINGETQLVPPDEGSLFLGLIKVEQSDSGETVPALVDSLVSLGADHRSLLLLLSYIDIGQTELQVSDYLHFVVTESRVYEVSHGFPRITPASFEGGVLPHGVITFTYRIDLSSEPPWPLDESRVEGLYRSLASGGADAPA